jgi:D-alanyl-D-alanine carboxypeptidase
MDYFERYELLSTADGYAVRLYISRNTTEFSSELFGSRRKKAAEKTSASLKDAAKNYVAKNLPGLKVRTAYIVFGALIIAAIPLMDSQNQGSAQHNAGPGSAIVTPDDKNVPDGQSTDAKTPDKIIGELPHSTSPRSNVETDGNLMLVNKTHPLPSDYAPSDLVTPHVAFKTGSSEVRQMRREAAGALEQLFAAAGEEGVNLYAISGYRSYDRQAAIFAASAKSHGSEAAANQYSARAGQSEHQTGLAMDVSSASAGYALTGGFGTTKEGAWLAENAYRFGFILRYQQGAESITGYQYEPWHIRYVGTSAAEEITNRQITLEEYLRK